MPVHNSDIADAMQQVADMLAIQGANEFRVRAYRNAARIVENLPANVTDMLEDGEDLTDQPGIGEDLAGKIEEVAETGRLAILDELREQLPEGVTEMLHLPDIGPKRAAKLHEQLDIASLGELKEAANRGEVAEVEGFGDKTQQNILEELERLGQHPGEPDRWRWARAEEYAEPLLEHLRGVEGVDQVVLAGSYRRRKETVGDLDILATCEDPERMMEAFVDYEDIDRVESKGTTRSTVWLRQGLQVDLRAVDTEAYGAALHYFTGSKAHNIAVRRRGQQRELKINEYGIFRDDERIGGATEQQVFEAVELPYIAPEIREDQGELEAAESDELPDLVGYDELRGDLHMHTDATDGRNTIRQMAEAAREIGHDYIAITDHSKNVTVAGGLDADGVQQHADEIDRVDEKLDGIRVLKGMEVDILEDGSLDLPDEVLGRLDVVVCSIHYNTGMSREKMTQRILRAMDNPHFGILAHPTGRLIGRRRAYEVDFETVVEAAVDRGCALEINAQPSRLDLNDQLARQARQIGATIVISTDAHSTAELHNQRLGVAQARRGWVETDDVLNTRSADDVLQMLER